MVCFTKSWNGIKGKLLLLCVRLLKYTNKRKHKYVRTDDLVIRSGVRLASDKAACCRPHYLHYL